MRLSVHSPCHHRAVLPTVAIEQAEQAMLHYNTDKEVAQALRNTFVKQVRTASEMLQTMDHSLLIRGVLPRKTARAGI